MGNWILNETDANIELMNKTLGVSNILSTLIANRGIRTKKAALRYLRPNLNTLGNIHLMKDLDNACKMILDSIKNQKKIIIYGDYDVDGVISTAILMKALLKHGAVVDFVIPKRDEEGYGLNLDAIKNIYNKSTDLLITCDNGISAFEEIEEAKKLGMEVIVLDHHEPAFKVDENGVIIDLIPSADLVINPKQRDCQYVFKQLCTGALAYRLVENLYQYSNKTFLEREEFLALAAIATICDMVSLLEENRVIVSAGLNIINQNKHVNIGLWSLLKEKLLIDKNISVFNVGFLLGPCINAAGRLTHAAEAVRLFIIEDEDNAKSIASNLCALNEKRKLLTLQAEKRVCKSLQSNHDKVILFYDEEIHESIAGIVAGRIKEALFHPVIVLTPSIDCVKGSCRSIECYNIFEELYKNRELFIRFGGHALAAGLSIKYDNIEILRKRLNDNCHLKESDFTPIIMIDKQLQPDQITFALADEINFLAPFGKDNPEPLFSAKKIRPSQLKIIDEKNTIIFTITLENSSSMGQIKAICFGLNEKWKEAINNIYDDYDSEKIFAGVLRTADFFMDVVYAIDINEYNGKFSVQMRLKDFNVYREKI